MMKRSMIMGAILCAFVAESASAACTSPATQVTGAALTALLSGNTVCAGTSGNNRWQEEHHTDGTLWDYKLGPTDPVDPTTQLGSWATNETANTVTYSYSGGSAFTFEVWDNGAGAAPRYSFCTGGTVDKDFSLVTGTGSGCGPAL